MKTFFTDIIPKLKRYSRKLDDLTMLKEQHWVLLEDLVSSKTKTVYIFRQNKELIISRNSVVEKAKWEYLGNDSILLDLESSSFLLKHGFFDENVLALKLDSQEGYTFFVNESKYEGELNSISRVLDFLVKKYLSQKKKNASNNEKIKTKTNEPPQSIKVKNDTLDYAKARKILDEKSENVVNRIIIFSIFLILIILIISKLK